jgi:tetratricopeptide (TPR) repeat protein
VTTQVSLVGDGLSRARLLVESRRYRDALAELGPVIAANPDAGEAFVLLALAHDGLGEDRAMLVAARRVVALWPDEAVGHRLVSIALCSAGRRWDGVDAARAACRMEPRSWEATAQCAVALADAGSRRARWHATLDRSRRIPLREACRLADTALAAAPDQVQAHFAVGFSQQAAGHRRRARVAYRSALALDPAHAPTHNNVALIDLRRGAIIAAARHLRASLRLEPDRPEARRNLDLLVTRAITLGWVFLAFVAVSALLVGHALGWPARAGVATVGLLSAVALAVRLVRLVTPRLVGWIAGRLRRRVRPWVDAALLLVLAVHLVALVVLPPAALHGLGGGYARLGWPLVRVLVPLRLLLLVTRPWDRGDPPR